MSNVIRTFSFVCLTCLILSCVTQPTVETNKDPEYNELLQKVFIILDVGDIQWDIVIREVGRETILLRDYLQEHLNEGFAQIGIDTEVVKLTGLELSEDIDSDIAEYGAETVLSVTAVLEGVNKRYKSTIGSRGFYAEAEGVYTFDISISDTALGKKIWKAKIKTSGDFTTGKVNRIIESLFLALKTDGLIEITPEAYTHEALLKES
jgi:hypothetical protein